MKIGSRSVLMAALAAMSSCSAPAASGLFTEIERPRDDFTPRAVLQDDVLLPPAEAVEFFPPDEEGGS